MTEPDVRIKVQDFGPIVEAAVDLRPLTVFVGPSNTGKTSLATLIYALHRASEGFGRMPPRADLVTEHLRWMDSEIVDQLNDEAREEVPRRPARGGRGRSRWRVVLEAHPIGVESLVGFDVRGRDLVGSKRLAESASARDRSMARMTRSSVQRFLAEQLDERGCVDLHGSCDEPCIERVCRRNRCLREDAQQCVHPPGIRCVWVLFRAASRTGLDASHAESRRAGPC